MPFKSIIFVNVSIFIEKAFIFKTTMTIFFKTIFSFADIRK